jgi:hypothetical protein
VNPKLWLTYAWTDNQDRNVDFIIQELQGNRIDVRFDRAQLIPGRRLWSQISSHIEGADASDAWAFAVSRNSLASEPCQEELAIALDRALRARGDEFPLIGIMLEPVGRELIPPAIRTRLYASISEPGWAKRVADGVYKRAPGYTSSPITPYHIQEHNHGGWLVIEVRPRAGSWRPCGAAVPLLEKDCLSTIAVGGPGLVPNPSFQGVLYPGESEDGRFFTLSNNIEATPSTSLYIFLRKRPSILVFGGPAGEYQVRLR